MSSVIKAKIYTMIKEAASAGWDHVPAFELVGSEHADFATNIAFKLASEAKANPKAVAEQIKAALEQDQTRYQEAQIASIEIAGPGYLNIMVSDPMLRKLAIEAPHVKPETEAGKKIVTEYSDPNPFKVLHVGHLYTSVVGDAISNLLAIAGGEVHRVNFGGDVGRHVAITMWAILRELGGENPEKLSDIPEGERSEWMAKCYVAGTQAFEDDDAAKVEVVELNKRIYGLHSINDHESPLAQIYWTCRTWSYDYFNDFYARIGTTFEKYYPESEVAGLGLETVKQQLAQGVYTESKGAVIYDGETEGLHTRVFINSEGLPTYEAKDVGLIMSKWRDYHFDRSIVITGNDITEYMKVVLSSVNKFEPELVARTTHITHGNVKLAGGVKMSSRKGNFLRAVDVIELATEANQASTGSSDEQVVLGAIKYAFLKPRIGADIVFIPEESVSLEGNSGPYLQYAHARARSILAKSDGATVSAVVEVYESGERILARKIAEYPEVIELAVTTLMPHHICTYLYELAQTFNRFYEGNRVMGNDRQAIRLELVHAYADVLRDGLTVLGIDAPDSL